MTSWIIVYIYFMGVILAGFAATMLVLRRARTEPAEIWLPVSFGLGLGILAVGFITSMILTGRMYWAFPLALASPGRLNRATR